MDLCIPGPFHIFERNAIELIFSEKKWSIMAVIFDISSNGTELKNESYCIDILGLCYSEEIRSNKHWFCNFGCNF